MRAFGKNYEQFYQNAKKKGIKFVKAKPVIYDRGKEDQVVLRYEDQESTHENLLRGFDMVVMSLGILPAWQPQKITGVPTAEDNFINLPYPKLSPTLTDKEGIFVAGTASGPKDIVDSIVEAGSAAMETANYLRSLASKAAA